MKNKISTLIDSNVAFAVMCASGMMEYRDWFISACTTNKKLMRELKAKKNRKLKHIYEIPLTKNDLSEFDKLKDQFHLVDVSDHGVVYDYPENPLKIAALRHEIDVCEDRLSRLKDRYTKCQQMPYSTKLKTCQRR